MKLLQKRRAYSAYFLAIRHHLSLNWSLKSKRTFAIEINVQDLLSSWSMIETITYLVFFTNCITYKFLGCLYICRKTRQISEVTQIWPLYKSNFKWLSIFYLKWMWNSLKLPDFITEVYAMLRSPHCNATFLCGFKIFLGAHFSVTFVNSKARHVKKYRTCATAVMTWVCFWTFLVHEQL